MLPSWIEPVGPAPAMDAIHSGTKIRKSITLIMEQIHWAQANALLGNAKMAKLITQNIGTVMCIGGNLSKGRRLELLTKRSLRYSTFSPKKHCLVAKDSSPACNTSAKYLFERFLCEKHAQPFRKVRSKRDSRIDPATSVVDKVSRCGIQDGHLNQRLKVSPNKEANDQICN